MGSYADPEARAEYLRDWHGRNPEKHKQYQDKWDAANPERLRARTRRHKRRYPEQHRAHEAVRRALRSGKLERGDCEQLGLECRGPVEAHHDDYAKPLDVRWLCKVHHVERHYPQKIGDEK